MSPCELKVKAAVILLDKMTQILIDNTADPMKLALQHRREFDEATRNDPALHAAGLEIAQELSEKD